MCSPLKTSLIAGGSATVTLSTVETLASAAEVSVISKSPVITGVNVHVPFSLSLIAAAAPAGSVAVYAGLHPAATEDVILSD